MSFEVCGDPDPLQLDLTQAEVRRLYGVAFEIALGLQTDRFEQAQMDHCQELLAKRYGVDMARYMIMHAMTDASELTYPIITF